MGDRDRTFPELLEAMSQRDRTRDIRTLDYAAASLYERSRARRTVMRWATGASEASELLDMLDLRPKEGETP